MRKVTLASFISMALMAALLMPSGAAAQDDDDPPSRVARLSFIRGAVSFEPAGTDDWVDATVNRPITTGDKLWSDRDREPRCTSARRQSISREHRLFVPKLDRQHSPAPTDRRHFAHTSKAAWRQRELRSRYAKSGLFGAASGNL